MSDDIKGYVPSNAGTIMLADLEDVLRSETGIIAPQDVAEIMCAIFKKIGRCPPLYLLAEAERNERALTNETEGDT